MRKVLPVRRPLHGLVGELPSSVELPSLATIDQFIDAVYDWWMAFHKGRSGTKNRKRAIGSYVILWKGFVDLEERRCKGQWFPGDINGGFVGYHLSFTVEGCLNEAYYGVMWQGSLVSCD